MLQPKYIFEMFENLLNIVEGYLSRQNTTAEVAEEVEAALFDVCEFRTDIETSGRAFQFQYLDQAVKEIQTIKTHVFSKYGYEPDIRRSMRELADIDNIIFGVQTYEEEEEDPEAALEGLDEYYEEMLSNIPEERFDTRSFSALVKIFELFDGCPEHIDSALKALEKMRNTLDSAWEKFHKASPDDEDRISTDYIRGEAIFTSGMEIWKDALEDLERYVSTMDAGDLQAGMEKLDEANRMLVTVQFMALREKEKTADAGTLS